MAMTVQIHNGVSTAPGTFTDVASGTAKFNRVDTLTGTTPIPTPTSTGTNFSYIKTFQIYISATGGLTMTSPKVEKVTSEGTTGTKLWHCTSHSSYTQATTYPSATGDNNVTAPTLNGASATAMPALGAGSAYTLTGGDSTGYKGYMVEVALGVDATNTTAGTTVSVPTLRWTWTEG